MSFVRALTCLIALLPFAACAPAAPTRPSAVPQSAEWAGGAEGGAWIQCGMRTKEPHLGYECSVFNEQGAPWAIGSFVYAERDSNGHYKAAMMPSPFKSLSFDGFDGERILLRKGKALVSDGTIDYPLGDGHGKRATFELGQRVGGEASY